MKKVAATARKQTFENSTLQALSRFELVQIEITFIHNEMMNSIKKLAIHQANLVFDRKRNRDKERD